MAIAVTRVGFCGWTLFNIGDAEAHLTLVLIGLLGRELTHRMTTAEFALTPTRLTALIGE